MGYPRRPLDDMPFAVEIWRGDVPQRTLIKGDNQLIVKAAYEEACRQYPNDTICFRFRNRLIAERIAGPF